MDEDRCSERQWGFLATDVPDAPACIWDCRQKFLKALLLQNETFETLCERLSGTGDTKRKEDAFRALYCCDSQLCGVDNLEANVNWVINTCQNVGYDSIRDPGPPKETYNCSSATLVGDEPQCQNKNPNMQTTSRMDTSQGLPTLTVSNEMTSMATSTQSSIGDPSLGASLDPNKSDKDDYVGSGGLSLGVKVTIGLTTFVGVVLIAVVAFYILKHRSKPPHRRPSLRQLIRRDGTPAHTDSPTPLVSPRISHLGPDGVPLTPPPPLKERKMLEVGAGSRPSSAGRPQTRAGFPASPVFAPRATKLTPRVEKATRAHGAGVSPPTSPLGSTANAHGSLKSVYSDPATAASATSAAATSSSDRTAAEPAWPRQSRETAHDIPSPGPPPTRALPSTPPNGHATWPSTETSSIRYGDIGVAIGMVTHNPANGVVLEKESRDLCEMTEQYGLDTHASWGSWTAEGGGGPGATVSPPKRDVHSPGMQEGDLERLGGRY